MIAIGKIPVGEVDAAVRVKVDVPEPFVVGGAKLAVAPAGNPERVKLTVLLNPLTPYTETTWLTLAPGVTLLEDGVTITEKSGVPPTPTTISLLVIGPNHWGFRGSSDSCNIWKPKLYVPGVNGATALKLNEATCPGSTWACSKSLRSTPQVVAPLLPKRWGVAAFSATDFHVVLPIFCIPIWTVNGMPGGTLTGLPVGTIRPYGAESFTGAAAVHCPFWLHPLSPVWLS
jgi:hypothetical protein